MEVGFAQVNGLASNLFNTYGPQAFEQLAFLVDQMSGPAYAAVQRKLEDYMSGNQYRKAAGGGSAASDVKNSDTQEPGATRGTKVDYSIPGYNAAVTLAAGKRQPQLTMKIGQSLTIDNSPNFLKDMNRKTCMSFDFAFRMNAVQDARSWHYQAFRHRWSNSQTVNSGSTETISYPTGTVLLQPGYASLQAFKPTGVANTATIDAINKSTLFSRVSLSDLEDMSYNLMYNIQARRPYLYNVEGQSPIELPRVLPVVLDQHPRCSFPYYVNTQFPTTQPTTLNSTAQIMPCLNRGVITYNFNNTGVHPCRVEAVILKVKRNAELPIEASDYLVTDAGTSYTGRVLSKLYEDSLGDNYVKHGKRNASTDPLQSHTAAGQRTETDIVDNPKVKFLPALSGVEASRTPFTEVSRQAMVLGAGDKRMMQIKLPGIHYNPVNSVSAKAALSINQMYNNVQPFDQHCYFVALAVNGLVSNSRLVNTAGADPVLGAINNNVFTEADIRVTGNYKEYIQAASLKEEYGTNMWNLGRLQEDEYSANVGTVPVTILPQKDIVVTTQSSTFQPSMDVPEE